MVDQFNVGKQGIRNLKKFYKKAPKAFQRVSAGVLTSMAVADYKQIPKTMDKLMTIRTPSIIRKATRFEKADKKQPVNQQQSRSGSIKTDRHDAWEHVQTGQGTRITQFADAGRKGGTSKGRGTGPAKAGKNKHQRPSDYNLPASSTIKFIQAVARQRPTGKYGRRKPFFIPERHKGMGRGIYRFVGGKVGTYKSGKRSFKNTLVGAKIKRLSTPGDWVKPKKKDWKNKTTQAAVDKLFVRHAWVDNTKRELKKIRPRKR